jgi:hypothetical protein
LSKSGKKTAVRATVTLFYFEIDGMKIEEGSG